MDGWTFRREQRIDLMLDNSTGGMGAIVRRPNLAVQVLRSMLR